MREIELYKFLLPKIKITKLKNIDGKEILDFRKSNKFNSELDYINSLDMPDIEYFLNLINQNRDFSLSNIKSLKNIKTNKNSTKLFRKNIYGEEMLFHVSNFLKDGSKNVLDLCSGNGENEEIFYNLGANAVVLTDYRSNNAHLLTDVHNLPFKKDSFDLVLCTQAMEHWYNPYEAIRQISLILKPGGMLICSVSFLERWHGNSFFHCSPHAIFSMCLNNNLSLNDFWLGNEPLNDLIASRTIYKSKIINKLIIDISDLIYSQFKDKKKLLRKQILSSKSYAFVATKENKKQNYTVSKLYNRSMH